MYTSGIMLSSTPLAVVATRCGRSAAVRLANAIPRIRRTRPRYVAHALLKRRIAFTVNSTIPPPPGGAPRRITRTCTSTPNNCNQRVVTVRIVSTDKSSSLCVQPTNVIFELYFANGKRRTAAYIMYETQRSGGTSCVKQPPSITPG